MTLNNFFHLSFLNYYVSMPMEKKGQCVRLSAISQVGRTCRARGFVIRGQKECQGPVWSPGGQSPYEYIKEYCKLPPHCPAESVSKPRQCRGQSASLALPSFEYRQGF